MIVVHVGYNNELDNRQRSSHGTGTIIVAYRRGSLGRRGRGSAPRRVSETNESLRSPSETIHGSLSSVSLTRRTHSLRSFVVARHARSFCCASLARYSLQQRFCSEPLLTRSLQSLVDAILVRRIASWRSIKDGSLISHGFGLGTKRVKFQYWIPASGTTLVAGMAVTLPLT